jgi:acyl-CoA hydrolase
VPAKRSHPPAIASAIAAKRRPPEAVLEHIGDGADVVVGIANGEPHAVVDAIEANADRLRDVRLHQMFPVRDRPYFHGVHPGVRHVSWFLSVANRDAFHRGTCELVPNNFSEVPRLLQRSTRCSLVIATVAPPDAHGYFSLGCQAGYCAALIGRVPFFVEVNPHMPRTFGNNQVHASQIVGWCETDAPLFEIPAHPQRDIDHRIASLVAERIPNGATLQIGIGAVPEFVLGLLHDHRELGVHTELFPEGFVDLIERGVITGTRKRTHRGKAVATGAMGSRKLFAFLHENPGIEFWPVDYTNDPRRIAQENQFMAVNATLEVDFLGQCASESLGSHYWSSTGGQADFARGAVFADDGQSFIVLHATTSDESISRIVPRLHLGAAVTTFKNIVDKVVTEYGVAELHGSSIRERTRRLIAIAHPKFRDDLEREAREMSYL